MKKFDSINLLELLEKQEKKIAEIDKYEGPRFYKRIQRSIARLLKLRTKYLIYCFSRFFPFNLRIRTFWGKNFHYFLPDGHNIYFFGLMADIQERKLTKFFIKNLKEDSIFYDIGANVGFYSALAGEIIKTGEIHSFEPLPKIFNYLKKNTFGYKNIYLNQVALFNLEGDIDFYNPPIGMRVSGLGTFDISNIRDAHYASYFKKIKVPATTLDKYCFNHKKPTFLKIDVEGAERFVIEGGINVLKKANPIIAIEIVRRPFNNYGKAIENLYSLGYKSFKINEKGELEFLEKIDLERDIPEKLFFDNFIFIKN